MKITRESKGLEIQVTAEPEDESPVGYFASDDKAADAALVQSILDREEHGDDWAWFTAHVRVTYRGVLSADAYLGACSYANEAEFREPGGYFDDLVSECIDEINAKLAVLELT